MRIPRQNETTTPHKEAQQKTTEVSKSKVGTIPEIIDGKPTRASEVSYYKLGKGNIATCTKPCDACIGLIPDIIHCLEEKPE